MNAKDVVSKLKSWTILVGICLLSFVISHFTFSALHLSPLIITIIVGALFGNIFTQSAKNLKYNGTLGFATKQILRLGIILFGFKLSLADIQSVGMIGVLFAFFIVFSTFGIGCVIGKMLGLDAKSFMLISSGSSVCGAAAVLSSESVLNGGGSRVAVAICTVVVFGTIGMFVYPILFKALDLNELEMGYIIGGSLHEVAHVVAAGAAVNEQVQGMAVIIKMLRVLMLVPFLLFLVILNLKLSGTLSLTSVKANVPWFALWFLVAIGVNSLSFFPHEMAPVIDFIDTMLLSIAMGALGIGIDKNVLKNAGKKPFVLAIVMFIWLFLACFVFVKNFI
ncbi:YeiH family protein [Campylobacter anatolicus]|uniref:YeiH family protein n=1 Tax=Campylobacter anatolicus TaxID=2829105 RepID=UPI0030B85036